MADDYANPADATRVRIHQLPDGGWMIDAADNAGRYTEKAWDAERDCVTPLTLDRAVALAPRFAESIGRPGIPVEVLRDGGG